jgi:hypothetical protein
MTVTRTYSCNLCRATSDAHELVGLHWSTFPAGWEEKAAIETENHICRRCVSNIQAMKTRCGQGFECRGGPKCSSDHK